MSKRRIFPAFPAEKAVDLGLFETAQTCTGKSGMMALEGALTTMSLLIAILVGLAATVIAVRVRVPGGVNPARLGWMSEQWLAEHRASRPS